MQTSDCLGTKREGGKERKDYKEEQHSWGIMNMLIILIRGQLHGCILTSKPQKVH